MKTKREAIIDWIIVLFFGILGVHKFREKKIGFGFLYLFTCGLFYIGYIKDVVVYFIRIFNTPSEIENGYSTYTNQYENIDNRYSKYINQYRSADKSIDSAKREKIAQLTNTIKQIKVEEPIRELNYKNFEDKSLDVSKENADIYESINKEMEVIDKLDQYDFVNYIADLLEKHNYSDIVTLDSNASIHILSKKNNKDYAIACISSFLHLEKDNLNSILEDLSNYNNTNIRIVISNTRFSKEFVESAERKNILLWERERLYSLVKRTLSTSVPIQNINEASNQPITTSFERNTITENNMYDTKTTKSNHSITIPETKIEEKTDYKKTSKKIQLGAGKYIFGKNIPLGIYNLTAINGTGTLKTYEYMDGELESNILILHFGINDEDTSTFYGMSLEKNEYFVITGNVIFEITKADILEI